jgi:hypothetical protein
VKEREQSTHGQESELVLKRMVATEEPSTELELGVGLLEEWRYDQSS